MMITEDGRAEIQRLLEARGRGTWLKLVSEVHRNGGEAPFWCLVRGLDRVAPAYAVFAAVLPPYLRRYDETRFSIAFDSKVDGRKINWEFLEDEELRAGPITRPLGLSPESTALRAEDIYGPNV
jgi:hypothetical protein